jgi:putative glutamine amidotransferase
MFRKFFFIPVLLALFACNSQNEFQIREPFQDDAKYIVLMHPTVFNLERFQFLTENDIFTLPGNYRAVGVYHLSASYNYNQSYDYIREKRLGNISMLGLSDELNEGNLFSSNGLSDDFRKIFENSEGIIFFGGPDIPPSIYGYPTSLLTVITDPHRHYLELSFLFHLLGGFQDEGFEPLLDQKPDYRILGICLGMQTMNIATGGTMFQDIPTELYDIHTVEDVLAQPADDQHRNYQIHFRTDPDVFPYSFHRIRVEKGSIMETVNRGTDITPYIASSHHQALKEIGKGWKVTAWSMDNKVVEAIEHDVYPNVFGIQFHPEVIRLYEEDPLIMVPDQTDGKSFFEGYPGEMGLDFHLGFWKYLGKVYDLDAGL